MLGKRHHFRHANFALKTTLKFIHMNTKKALLICFLTFIALNAFANDESQENLKDNSQWYQIEYIIFEHKGTDDHILRYEDTPYPIAQNKQYTYLTTNLYPASPFQFTRLDKEKSELNKALTQLVKSSLVTVLDSGAWQQSLSEDTLSPALHINKLVSEERTLFGEIQLRKSRFTHAEFKLYLTKPVHMIYDNVSDWFFDQSPQSSVIDLFISSKEASPIEMTETNIMHTNIIYLNESRRIKEGEIHYIDHPVLSAIITIKENDIHEHLNRYSGD